MHFNPSKPEQLTFLEASVNYTILHYADGSTEIHSYTLKKFEEKLDSLKSFSRIHRRYLVNTAFVKRRNTEEVLLFCGKRLPVARRRRVNP